MLNFSSAEMRYHPYPLAVLRPAIDPALYNELIDTYPRAELFGSVPKYDYKLSLSEKFNAQNYHRFITEKPAWRTFHAWLKSDDFIRQTVGFLASQNIDVGVKDAFEPAGKKVGRVLQSIAKGRLPSRPTTLRSRFEFSILKADGGEVAPHTDTPKKIITLVLSMIRDGEWKEEYGGGLDINRATDNTFAYNWTNRMVPWDKIEVMETVPFVPNQCMIFVKTFNSLHSVRKMQQKGSSALRKTITIVIEHDE
ncbi:hypothetical protein BH10PSE7_BH10PSE7_13900 [soil metagenome]